MHGQNYPGAYRDVPMPSTLAVDPQSVGAIIDQTENVLMEASHELRALLERVEPTPNKMDQAGPPMPSSPGLMERASRLRNLAHCLQEDVKRLSGKL